MKYKISVGLAISVKSRDSRLLNVKKTAVFQAVFKMTADGGTQSSQHGLYTNFMVLTSV